MPNQAKDPLKEYELVILIICLMYICKNCKIYRVNNSEKICKCCGFINDNSKQTLLKDYK